MSKVKKISALVFSGTGNTQWVVEQLEKKLKNKNHEFTTAYADELQAGCGREPGKEPDWACVREKIDELVTPCDILLLAFPTYASDIPTPLKELLQYIPDGQGKKLVVISTIHMAGGDAVLLPSKILEKKNYETIITEYVKMPNNIKIPLFDFIEIKNGEDLKPFYDSAGKTIDKIIEQLVNEKKHIEGKSITDKALGFGQRLGEETIRKMFINNMFATANCIKCGLCAATCPTGNISFDKGYPEFNGNCCMCLRCYNFCPVNAIQISDKTRQEKFTRYKGFDGWKPVRLRKIKQNVETE
ncbi:MAG: EFR1 family ferrodoxin [Vulcanimicrobiota bacterium]